MTFGSEDIKLPAPDSKHKTTALLLKEWPSDQDLQHEHHLGDCLILRLSRPTRFAFEVESWVTHMSTELEEVLVQTRFFSPSQLDIITCAGCCKCLTASLDTVK